MVQERNFPEYLRALKELLSDHFEEKFYFSSGSDIPAARELFKLNVPPEEVLSCLVNYGGELISRRFNLFQVKELVKEKLPKEKSSSLPQPSPLNRVELLLDFVGSLLKKLGLSGRELIGELKELLEEEDSLKVERELYRLEGELFKLLESTPAALECKREARKKLEKYSFYWNKRVLELTERALIRECLRKRYGVPEFTSLDSP
ncbi:hypothetical protein [Thermovibrio sp.]